jgi:hypothetical protein
MDYDELAKFKRILLAGVVFLISAYYSYQEIKFAIWGATAEATVTRTFETKVKRRQLLAVEYKFSDEDGKRYSERDDVPIDWPVPASVVTVQYLPGVDDSSRLEGHSSSAAVWIFLACSAWLAFSGYKIYKEASEAVHGTKRRR